MTCAEFRNQFEGIGTPDQLIDPDEITTDEHPIVLHLRACKSCDLWLKEQEKENDWLYEIIKKPKP